MLRCLLKIKLFFLGEENALSTSESEKRAKTSVVIVGAGYSGLCMAIKLKKARIPYVILEKSDQIGGTWSDNTYPGCACDIMSHLYSFSFFPNPYWTTSFPAQPEIKRYLETVVAHYDLMPNIRLRTRVDSCKFDETSRGWTVISTTGETFRGQFLVSGIGALHVPNTPNFPGKDDFRGVSFHTAEWNHDFDVTDKNIAMIGTGASCVQVLPSIAGLVESISVFQRTAVWVAQRLEFAYSSWVQALFNAFPLLMKLHRWYIFVRQELGYFWVFAKGTARGKVIRRQVIHYMRSQLAKDKNPELLEKLIPNFDLGCKRLTVSNDYVKSYNSDKVKLVTDPIERIVENGILVKGASEATPFDAIIYATGFDLMASCNNMRIEGTKGAVLSETWGDLPNAYLGITCPKFPNLFYLLGPNVGLGHNSVVWMIECQVTYIMDAILKCVEKDIGAIEVKEDTNRGFQDYIQGLMKGRVFHSGCKSWYQNDRGLVFALWPSHLTHYWWLTRKMDLKDYVLF